MGSVRRRSIGAALAFVAATVGWCSMAGTASAAPIASICAGTTTGTTFTLTADCSTTEPLMVPDGFTLDGAGHTISATDIGGSQWDGAIVTNAGGSMNIQNVTVAGPVGGFQVCTNSLNALMGILFDSASGSVTNVIVEHIWQQPTASPSCQTGRAIVVRGTGTVTITGTEVRDYQKNGIEARGSVTVNVSGSTMGPPRDLDGLIAQNGLVYVGGASGTATENIIFGSGDQSQGPPVGGTDGTAVILYGASNVTIDHNTITGAQTDIGIAVVAGSTGIVISFNEVARTAPDVPDPTGIGIGVDPPATRVSATGPFDAQQGASSATLICNTFTGWNTNIVGAIQIGCTPLPDGIECTPYSGHTPSVEGGTEPFTWSQTSGALPAGLTLAPDGTISGTPTLIGAFEFTVRVVDANQLTASADEQITITPGCAAVAGETATGASTGESSGTLPATGSNHNAAITGIALVLAGFALASIAFKTRPETRP